jgi:hydroxyacylglutathione hydrolase
MSDKVRIIELGFVNAYLLKADNGFVLIDTGLSKQKDQLENQLKSAGCTPENLKLVIITHGDADHTGNAAFLKDKYNAKIAVHPKDINQAENGIFLKRKVSNPLFKIIFAFMMLKSKLQKNQPIFPKFKTDIQLSDGQSLDEYGLKAKIIHIPGHTDGSIGVLTDDGDFFAGDTFVNYKKPAIAIIIQNQSELRESIDKIKKLNIGTVYPGHGKPFPIKNLFCSKA